MCVRSYSVRNQTNAPPTSQATGVSGRQLTLYMKIHMLLKKPFGHAERNII